MPQVRLRVAQLAVIVASLTLADLSCNGGVNPGQIHQHQHEGPLPVHCSAQVGPTCIGATPGPELVSIRWTGGSVVPRSPKSASAALAMKTAIGTCAPARRSAGRAPRRVCRAGTSSCEGVNILIEPSMIRIGFPHHPGSQVEGKVRIVAGACPPTSGTVTAWLQRYSFPPLGSPPGTLGDWDVVAGPRSVSVAGIEAPRVIRFLDAVCRPHHWWRLRIHGEDITDQGVPTSFTRCWPGGGVEWRCFRGRQGRFYLSCG